MPTKKTRVDEQRHERKFESYFKACHIENFEEWLTFSDEKQSDLSITVR